MSYTKSLRNTLKDRNDALFNRLAQIENAAKSVLTYTVAKFPYYTPHDFSHSQNVEEILNWLIPDETRLKMNEHEIFFLLIAAWLHDWGMVASKSEDAEEVRNLHNIRSETNFEKLHDKIHLSLAEARIAGRICRGHRQENLLGSGYDDSFLGSNILIRVRFLAALLRIADECDVTSNRTPEVVYYSINPEGASEEEFQKHLSIDGIGKPTPYKLLLNGVAKTPKGVEVIEGVKRRIQSQLDSVKAILASHGVILDLVDAHIDTRGFINRPIAFELDREAIVRLLIGTALYSREDTAIRELLQNAVDTCRLRDLVESNVSPCIEIEFDKEKISFQDNGLGMNFEDAFDFFSRKGNSFYVSDNLKDILNGRKFDPISKFGIGVLSSFIISDKMVIETKKHNCTPCRFTITNLAEGWTYEEGSRQESGTKITLFLNSRGQAVNIDKSLSHYAKAVSIPIFIKNAESGERRKFVPTWDYSIPEVPEICSPNDRAEFSKSKPILTLHKATSDLDVTYHLFEKPYFSSENKNCFLLKHGIYVGNFELFPSTSSKWIALIDCKSDLVDLRVSREELVANKKFEGFLDAVYDTLFNAVAEISNHNAKNLDGIEKFSTYMQQFFVDFLGVDEKSQKKIWFSKLLTKRIYPVLRTAGLSFLSGDQVLSRRFSKIIHYRLPLASCKAHVKEVTKIYRSRLKDNEALIFDFGPHFCIIESASHKFLCAFCKISKFHESEATECMELATLISRLEFKKESTDLDALLPHGSFFTHMPVSFRCLVAQLKEFEFSPSIETIVESRTVKKILIHNLLVRELFSADQDVAEIYDPILSLIQKQFKLVSEGYFAYDIDDPFLRFIISKAKNVVSRKSLRKLVERYLRTLPTYHMKVQLFWVHHNVEEHPIILLEKTIADMLDYPEKYVPIKARMGELAKVYNLKVS